MARWGRVAAIAAAFVFLGGPSAQATSGTYVDGYWQATFYPKGGTVTEYHIETGSGCQFKAYSTAIYDYAYTKWTTTGYTCDDQLWVVVYYSAANGNWAGWGPVIRNTSNAYYQAPGNLQWSTHLLSG